MKLRLRRREEPEIILIPLIDILLMLLIFFMLATTFKRTSEMPINLPEASQQPLPDVEKKSLAITIDDNGRFFIDEQAVMHSDIETVKRALQQAAGERKDWLVTISADAHTLHKSVITAMDAAQQLGLFKIGIATQQSKVPAN